MFALRASLVFRSFSTTIPVPKKKGDYIPRHRPSKQQKAVIVSQESERLASEVIKHSLSNEQQALLDHVVESGSNMFFSGAAGTGKTYLVNHMVNALRVKHKKNVAVTSSTGITAFNLGGTTVHSWAGVGTGETSLEEIIKSLSLPDARATKQRWLTTDVLVLDEVSMIDATLFDKLDAVGRDIRKIDAPFGGIQLLITGDFFQLPPVSAGTQTRYAFQAKGWSKAVGLEVKLTQIFRQQDPILIYHLNKVRGGTLDQDTDEFFRGLERPEWGPDPVLTKLLPTRTQVEHENLRQLKALPGKLHRFQGINYLSSKPHHRSQLRSIANDFKPSVPTTLDLKVGARVMVVNNVIPGKIVNGTTGTIHSFTTCQGANQGSLEGDIRRPIHLLDTYVGPNTFHQLRPGDVFDYRFDGLPRGKAEIEIELSPVVARYEHEDPTIYPVVEIADELFLVRPMALKQTREIDGKEDEKEVVAARYQIPLILSYAISIHKAQGQSLDRVQVNFKNMFADGQAYVALSRARSLEGLQVLNWDPNLVQASSDVLRYMKSLKVVDLDEE